MVRVACSSLYLQASLGNRQRTWYTTNWRKYSTTATLEAASARIFCEMIANLGKMISLEHKNYIACD
uniref:Uncharacterized protein n=1 Tax=Romanomermis culicivorax TaxID=13658 RepID=A0A915I419_ROMCU